MRSATAAAAAAALCLAFLLQPAHALERAGGRATPMARLHALLPEAALPALEAAPLDRAALAAEDRLREAAGLAPRFALPQAVSSRPERDGLWEEVDELSVWRLAIRAPGAASLNLGFRRYRMPEGGRLLLYSADGEHGMRPFTARDNAPHGELWTAILPVDALVVEVSLPTARRDELDLELSSVNVGYRGFGKAGAEKSGACNVDVACPDAEPWRDEIASVGAYSTGGALFCTGFLVNNTLGNARPYFLTARHCGVDAGNAASLVVYWNFETTCCGGTPDGSLEEFQTGATFRASWAPSDFTLLELDDLPDPALGLAWAGWDRSGADASSAVAIHHPSVDEKRISFEDDPTTVTSYLGSEVPGDGTSIRVADWDAGTTEAGSSGSPLFDPSGRAIGQLRGGDAACGNDEADWYGRFFVSWTGGGTPATRLSDWLDPGTSGALTVDTLRPSSVTSAFGMDADPGWTAEGLWAWGVPLGGGGAPGAPDPTAGYTGSHVYGYNLAGDYEHDLPERHLTSGALDLTGRVGARLAFRRWLNVEDPAFDGASLRVSQDGSLWTTVWQNESEVLDACWHRVEYDLSGVADGASSLFLRWTMGPTDSTWRYSGWNLDDVELRTVPEPPTGWALPAAVALLAGLARRRAR